MEKRLYFIIGDLFANAFVATVAVALTAWLLGGSWGMIPGMLVGMLIGMAVALPLSLALLSPILGVMEVISPCMISGMLGGMWGRHVAVGRERYFSLGCRHRHCRDSHSLRVERSGKWAAEIRGLNVDTVTREKWDRASRSLDLMSSFGPEWRWKPAKKGVFRHMKPDSKILFLALGTGLDIGSFSSGARYHGHRYQPEDGRKSREAGRQLSGQYDHAGNGCA